MFDRLNPDADTVVQTVNVTCSSDHVFSVQLTNDNSTNLRLMDMPLLIDLSTSKDSEIFVNASVASIDDFNNNPPASLHLQTNFVVTNSQPLQLSDSCEYDTFDKPVADIYASDYDITEFLILNKKSPTDTDPKLRSSCYVKLKSISESAIVETEKSDTCEGERRLHERGILSTENDTSRVTRCSSSRKLESTDHEQSKHTTETGRTDVNKQPNVASDTSRRVLKRRNPRNRTNAPPAKKINQNQPNLAKSTLHVSWKSENEFGSSDNECAVHPINETWKHPETGGIADEKPKTILKIVRDKSSNSYRCYPVYRIPDRFGIKNCSVSIQRLPTLQQRIPSRGQRRLKTKYDQRWPKTDNVSMTRQREKVRSLFEDIEAFDLPLSKKNLRMTKLETDTEADEGKDTNPSDPTPLSTDTNGCRTNQLENEIRNVRTELTEQTETCADDGDDNLSTSSFISMDTPSLSGIDDWIDEDTKRVNPTAGWNLKDYQIPKKVSAASQKKPQERAMDDEIDEILPETVRNSSKTISPLKGLTKTSRPPLKLTEHQKDQKSNGQSSVTQTNGPTVLNDAPNHPKFKQTSGSNQPENSNGLNECTEIIVATTKKTDNNESTTPLNAPYRSTMDFKNVEKLTINVRDLNSARTVSLSNANATAMVAHAQTVPQAAPVYNERMLNVPAHQPIANANYTSMAPHSLSAAQVQCDKRMHIVPAQSTLNVDGQNIVTHAPAAPGPCQPPTNLQLPSQPIDSAQLNSNVSLSSPDTKRRYFSTTMRVFEQPCINYFEHRPCREGSSCHYKHQLPHANQIFETMKTFPDDQIHFIYSSFIVKYLTTFSQYFPMICYLFGSRKMKEALVLSVKDCNSYKRYEFYRFIFGGLLMSGLQDWEALQIFHVFADVCEASVVALTEIGKNPTNPFQS